MIVFIDDLLQTLKESGLPDGGMAPDSVLSIDFAWPGRGISRVDCEELDCVYRSSVVIDVEASGRAVSIELLSAAFEDLPSGSFPKRVAFDPFLSGPDDYLQRRSSQEGEG